MRDINVVCRNEKELLKITEIAEKEGYQWIGGATLPEYKPSGKRYPYEILFRKVLTYNCFCTKDSSSAKDFINDYNIDHTEPCEISEKVKNEIILDFMEKWHDVLEECGGKECENCVLYDGECKAELMEYSGNKNAFMDAAKFMIKAMEEK